MSDKSPPDRSALRLQTKAIHNIANAHDRTALNAPIYLSATFGFDSADEAILAARGESDQYIYSRSANPTQNVLEQQLAELEGAGGAVVTGSGMAAISSSLLTLLSAGDEILVHKDMYRHAAALVQEELPRFGIRYQAVDMRDQVALSHAITPRTKLVYFESLVNPAMDVLDIRALSDIAHAANARVLVDATCVSPALQRPLELGADLVVHSLTKYINGHGDLLGGAVLSDSETINRIRSVGLKCLTGATLSPMSCFLILRSLKTLDIRMQRHGENGLRIAKMLQKHVAVRTVRYPFLPEDPGYATAVRQMKHGSGMLGLDLHSGERGARKFVERLRLFSFAVSLGDAESLVTLPGLLANKSESGTPSTICHDGAQRGWVRLSVGLEDAQDLIDDLEQALAGVE